jgi:hypothetical protein
MRFSFFCLLALVSSSSVPSLEGNALSKAEWDEQIAQSRRLVEGIAACNACENQMFDCSDSCDCAWGGSDIVQCMMCNSKCTAKKCAAYCAKIGQGGGRRLRGE